MPESSFSLREIIRIVRFRGGPPSIRAAPTITRRGGGAFRGGGERGWEIYDCIIEP